MTPERIGPRILVVRLGAMGDVLHTLPAVATLKLGIPGAHITWAIEPKWTGLLAGNPHVDCVLPVERRPAQAALRSLRRLADAGPFDVAVDFQGLLKSAVVARAARPRRVLGLDSRQVRERWAALLYDRTHAVTATHVVDRHLELALAAGAQRAQVLFPIPPGEPEGDLPHGLFVLASPLAGWGAKQWPLDRYAALAARLRSDWGVSLVLNGAPSAAALLASVEGIVPHISGINGLIDATRRAIAIVGLDSGPTHLAAAMGKPGVALFGPTDPARNGPYGGTMTVLRQPGAQTTYRRSEESAASMRALSVDAVRQALCATCARAEAAR